MSTAEEAAGGNGSRRPGDGEQLAPLLAPDEAEDVGARWQSIQAGFVDHPRQSVHEADALVTDLMEQAHADVRGRARDARGAMVGA